MRIDSSANPAPVAEAVIREIEARDRPGWDTLWRGYLDFYEAHLSEEISALTFRRLLDPAAPMFALVAEQAGALVGLAHCVLHPATWAEGPYCYLEDLFVAPEARDLGLGRKLIEAVYRHADARGAARVYWLTHETNGTARVLYDSVGKRSGFIQYRRT